jgi:hypothetical protein
VPPTRPELAAAVVMVGPGRYWWLRASCVACLLALGACAEKPGIGPAAPKTKGDPVGFSFGTTEGELFGSAETRGRSTAVLFVTTFDLASQAQARFLNEVFKEHQPRPHVAAVVLEPPIHRVLAEAFRTSLGLDFPVALANPTTLSGDGPFGRILGVPTLVVLDATGRVAFRSAGAVPKKTMDAAFTAADAGQMLPTP